MGSLSQVQFKLCMLNVYKAFKAFFKDVSQGNFRLCKFDTVHFLTTLSKEV